MRTNPKTTSETILPALSTIRAPVTYRQETSPRVHPHRSARRSFAATLSVRAARTPHAREPWPPQHRRLAIRRQQLGRCWRQPGNDPHPGGGRRKIIPAPHCGLCGISGAAGPHHRRSATRDTGSLAIRSECRQGEVLPAQGGGPGGRTPRGGLPMMALIGLLVPEFDTKGHRQFRCLCRIRPCIGRLLVTGTRRYVHPWQRCERFVY